MRDKKEVITDRDVLRVYDPIKKESTLVADDTWQYRIIEEVDKFMLSWHKRNKHTHIINKKIILCGHYVNIKLDRFYMYGIKYLIKIDTADFYEKVNGRYIYRLEKEFAYYTTINQA